MALAALAPEHLHPSGYPAWLAAIRDADTENGELARLQSENAPITMPLTVEAWGERAFQVRDPNGIIVQLVDWNGPQSEPEVAAEAAV